MKWDAQSVVRSREGRRQWEILSDKYSNITSIRQVDTCLWKVVKMIKLCKLLVDYTPWEADSETEINVQDIYQYLESALGIWIGRMGRRFGQKENLSCDIIPRKFSAKPMESSGTGIAFDFSQPGARGSGLYTHIVINHWIRAACRRWHDLG